MSSKLKAVSNHTEARRPEGYCTTYRLKAPQGNTAFGGSAERNSTGQAKLKVYYLAADPTLHKASSRQATRRFTLLNPPEKACEAEFHPETSAGVTGQAGQAQTAVKCYRI
jgi:hypothetical protein